MGIIAVETFQNFSVSSLRIIVEKNNSNIRNASGRGKLETSKNSNFIKLIADAYFEVYEQQVIRLISVFINLRNNLWYEVYN